MNLTFIGYGGFRHATDAETRLCEDHDIAAPLAEMRDYWEGLRRDGALPRRSAIDPRGLAGALAGAFLVERIAPGIARLRIAGRQISELLGMEGAGLPLSALFEPAARGRLAELLESCLTAPATLNLCFGSENGLGRPHLRGRMILLPLAPDGGRGEMALGGLSLAGTVGRQPRRLSLEDARSQPIPLPRYRRIAPLEEFDGTPAPNPARAPLRLVDPAR